MESGVKFRPLSGAFDQSPPCYLLQLDDFTFLVDCGWDGSLSESAISEVASVVHEIDAVLLSYPDLLHLGALPYLVGKCGLRCDIYATVPVFKMGQMFMYDFYQSRQNYEDFDVFTLDDVDTAFEQIKQLKYSQSVTLKGKGLGITITPQAAGHLIGGTVWKIAKQGEEIVYAIDYNHRKERHLDGAFLETIAKPTLLITDAFSAWTPQPRRKERDQNLQVTIQNTLRSGGNVLMCVDTAGRVLEISQTLEHMWRNRDTGLATYSLVLLNNVAYNVIEFAKSQMEWMSDKIMKVFSDQRNNPFQFKHLTLCHSLKEAEKLKDPKVVLASVDDLECGFSRELFIQWAENKKNTIILTSKPAQGTLARTLIDQPKLNVVELQIRKKVELQGEELEEFKREQLERQQREVREEVAMQMKLRRRTMDGLMDDSDEDDVDMEDVDGNGFQEHKAILAKTYPLFPCYERRIKWDAYGEIIRPEDYILIDGMVEERAPVVIKKVEEPVEEEIEIPMKAVVCTKTIRINCSVIHIDLEGRSDGESIKKILNQIKPKQVIIVHGNPEQTGYLADYCRQAANWATGEVFTPHIGETINVTSQTHMYQAKLRDSLVNHLQFVKAKDFELAWIDAKTYLDTEALNTVTRRKTKSRDMDSDDESEDSDQMETGELAVGILPELDAAPQTEIKGHPDIFVNEPRLSDFKQILTKAGMQVEFSGGVLICNNIIAIRRNEPGHISIEGPISDDYYKVRKFLYEQYAVI
eukprot:m.17358 g.17358  ORF g.17358 m.17358 type:complete len:752 (+) comp27458_c0_seq1:6-2261(+)